MHMLACARAAGAAFIYILYLYFVYFVFWRPKTNHAHVRQVCIRDCVQVCHACHTYAYVTVCRCVIRMHTRLCAGVSCAHVYTHKLSWVHVYTHRAQTFPLSPTMMYITFRKCQLTFADSSCIYDVYSHVFLQKKKILSEDVSWHLPTAHVYMTYILMYLLMYIYDVYTVKKMSAPQTGSKRYKWNLDKLSQNPTHRTHTRTCSKDM